MIEKMSCFSFRFPTLLLAIVGGLLFSGCNKMDGKVRLTGPRTPDFARSKVYLSGPTLADGASELLITLQLLNSDGSPIKNFRPIYEVVSGAGVQIADCSLSTNDGTSTCILKSTIPGTKRLLFTNLKNPIEKEVSFSAAQMRGVLFGLTPAAEYHLESAGGAELSGSFGAALHSELISTGTNGWTLYGGAEGNAITQ